MKTIIHFFRIHASADEVFDALVTASGLAGWWSNRVEAEQSVGGTIRFRFVEGFNPVMEITAQSRPELVSWKCVDGHHKWQDNTFRFEIHAAEREADVKFVQEYARELSDKDYGTYNFNWGYYLGSLKKLCETGEGMPFESAD